MDVKATVIGFHSYNGVSRSKLPFFTTLSAFGIIPIKIVDDMLTGPSIS